MKINQPWIQKLIGFTGAGAIRSWMRTLDYAVAYYDPSIDPARPEFDGQKIYVFWHEYLLLPIHMRGNCHFSMLISKHRDAELLARAARHLGFSCVRGSTNRGGVAALRELVRQGRNMNLVITPDGPRGPRRVMAQGAVYLASRLQLPLVTMGFGYDRPWRARSWDRFAIPRPFSRGRAVVGPPLSIPADLDREGIEHYRLQTQRLLNRLTLEAEQWAESGMRKAQEQAARRSGAYYLPSQLRRAA